MTALGSQEGATVPGSWEGSQYQLHWFLLFSCLHHSILMIILIFRKEHFGVCAVNRGNSYLLAWVSHWRDVNIGENLILLLLKETERWNILFFSWSRIRSAFWCLQVSHLPPWSWGEGRVKTHVTGVMFYVLWFKHEGHLHFKLTFTMSRAGPLGTSQLGLRDMKCSSPSLCHCTGVTIDTLLWPLPCHHLGSLVIFFLNSQIQNPECKVRRIFVLC